MADERAGQPLELVEESRGRRWLPFGRGKSVAEWNSSEPELVRREFQTLAALAGCGVPAPEPVWLDADGAIAGVPAHLTRRPPGVVSVRRTVRGAAALASALAGVHAIPDAATRFAHLPASGESPVLLHGAFWAGNILWRRSGVTGILDWEAASLGPAAADVAFCRVDLLLLAGAEAAEAFRVAYEAVRGPVVDLAAHDRAATERALAELPEWQASYADLGRRDLTGPVLQERLEDLRSSG